jgi:hypothetical protein
MSNKIGSIRRSHIVTTYGPGSIIDFRNPSGAPLSGVLSGLEEWDSAARDNNAGLNHPQVIHEVRLERRLGVAGFRLPPVKSSRNEREQASSIDVLPIVRFPDWLQCAQCNRIRRAEQWKRDPGKPERWCEQCSAEEGDKVWAVPVRFIVACENSHIGDFPWQEWIGCSCDSPALKLDSRGAGLAGKVVQCTKCKRERSMDGVFAKHAMISIGRKCCGREPWIAGASESTCHEPLRVLQRGASNVYWGDTTSALDIPPYSPDPGAMFGPHWPTIRALPPEVREQVIRSLAPQLPSPPEVLLRALDEWTTTIDSDDKEQPIEWAEYRQFQRSLKERVTRPDFETRPEKCPSEFQSILDGVVLARRLREVRVQVGFTRISPPGGMFRAEQGTKGRLSKTQLPWLPAIEMRGEGIYLEFNHSEVARWEKSEAVELHFSRYAKQLKADLEREAKTEETLKLIRQKFDTWVDHGPRFVMLHSFAHAFMRRLSLECGYSSSALRERLYVNRTGLDMLGVLIHTDSPDSEGTLGGLVRQGQPERLYSTLVGMLRDLSWCSSDPICITGTMTLSSPRNGAACHACLLAPETSCQHFNTLLDRALLVGTEGKRPVGFLRPLIDELT